MVQTNRKNRERAGGYKSSMPKGHRFGDECNQCTAVERKIIKRLTLKKVRRQWRNTQQQVALEHANDWTVDDLMQELEEYDLRWADYDEACDWDDYREVELDDEYDPRDYMYDHCDYSLFDDQ